MTRYTVEVTRKYKKSNTTNKEIIYVSTRRSESLDTLLRDLIEIQERHILANYVILNTETVKKERSIDYYYDKELNKTTTRKLKNYWNWCNKTYGVAK